MTADNADNKEASKRYGLKDMGVDVATLTASHPMALVKNSIQLGHRPLDDYTARSWVPWKTATFRPGFMPHAKHILNANGIGGPFQRVAAPSQQLLAFQHYQTFDPEAG